MTRALMGYATPTELSVIHAGCEVRSDCRAVVDVLFPARKPHVIHEGLAFAEPPEFGLVP